MATFNNENGQWTRWIVWGVIVVAMAVFGFVIHEVGVKVDASEYQQSYQNFKEESNRRFGNIEKKLDRMDEKSDKVQSTLTQILIKIGKMEVQLEKSNGANN